MASHPRIEVAGATVAITRRTNLRKAFLAPWHPEVLKCWLYALAFAQKLTEVAIHHSVLVIAELLISPRVSKACPLLISPRLSKACPENGRLDRSKSALLITC